jgi:hypothetical protein
MKKKTQEQGSPATPRDGGGNAKKIAVKGVLKPADGRSRTTGYDGHRNMFSLSMAKTDFLLFRSPRM